MKKRIMLGFGLMMLLSGTSNVLAYKYRIYNYRRTPVEVQVITTLVGAPKPKVKVPAGKKIEKIIPTPEGGRKTADIEPGFKELKIGGFYRGACFKEIKVNGKPFARSLALSYPCDNYPFSIGKNTVVVTGPKSKWWRVTDTFKFGDWVR